MSSGCWRNRKVYMPLLSCNTKMTEVGGVLVRSNKGGCVNYDPDRSRPTGVKARDVEGLILYECLNCKPTDAGRDIRHTCGGVEYCTNYEPKDRR